MVVAVLAIFDVLEPVALMSADRSDDGLGKLPALRDRLEPLDRRLDRAPADLELLLLLGLALAAARIARPSLRTTNGSVSPSPTRVTKMTQKVKIKIRSRSGNGLPSATVKGIASAAASETMPRIPVNASRNGCCHGG